MKTNYVRLSENQVNVVRGLISTAEGKQNEAKVVLKAIRHELKVNSTLEDHVVAVDIDNNWNRFLELWALQMPHVWYNGEKQPTVVDWVKDTENFKLKKAIKSYRFTDDEQPQTVANCFNGRVERKTTVNMTEVVTLKSGYELEVPSRDENGDIITTEEVKTFVPKAKSKWGFSKTLVEAFLAAADDLEEELWNKKQQESK